MPQFGENTIEPYDEEYGEYEGGESYCWDCGGRGWKVTCPDECIHGDPPTPCWTCNRKGENEDRLYG